MAYITQYNFKRIFYSLNTQKIISDADVNREILCEDVPNSKFEMLNKSERRRLLAFKEYVQCGEIALNKDYQKINTEDTGRYITENNHPAYHIDGNCERLFADFAAVEIPAMIREQGSEKITEFRAWYNKHASMLEESDAKRENFYLLLHAKFGVVREDFVYVQHNNSGRVHIDNASGDEVVLKIKALLEKWTLWLSDESDKQEFEKRLFVINKSFRGKNAYQYNSTEPLNWGGCFTDDEYKKVLETIQLDFKQPLESLLEEYYRVKYNPDLQMDEDVLSQLGFCACPYCCYTKVDITGF